MKKIGSLLLILAVILSCFNVVYAAEFNYVFDDTDRTTLDMRTGHNVSVNADWRTKTVEEGKMGYDDNGWFDCASNRLYLGAVRAGAYETFHYRYNSGTDFDNGQNMMSALVFKGDRTNMTAAQRIKLSAFKNDNDGISWGIRFMVHNEGQNYYAIAFGGNDTYNDTKTGMVAYYIYKVENNTTYTPLKTVLTSDVDGKQITMGSWANFELMYNNGNISFTCEQGDTVFKDSVTDTNNPYVLSGNEQTIWLTCTGAKETYEARHVAFKDISISNYDVEKDFVDGLLKYDLFKYTDGSKTIATATLKGFKAGLVNGEFDANVNVPKYVEKGNVQYLVNRVADNAFYTETYAENIYFDKTEITDFGANVFCDQIYLQNVTLPSTAESLGENAFRGCVKLCSVNIPGKITTISAGTFFNTSIHKQLTITFEGNNALNFSAYNPSNYEKPAFGINEQNYIIKVCSTVPKTSIKSYMKTENITKYDFENYEKTASGSYSDGTLAYDTSSVTKIEVVNGAEQDVSENTATVKGFDAAMNVEYENDGTTEKLKDIVIPENISVNGSNYAVTAVADYALHPDTDSKNIIKSITVEGTNLKSIGNSSFRGQSNLTTVKLPESLMSIGTEAFKACEYLKNINIPANVNEIKAGTFQVIRTYGGSGAVFNIEGNKLAIDSNAFSSHQKIYFITNSTDIKTSLDTASPNDGNYMVLNDANRNKIIQNGNELLFNVQYDGTYKLYVAGYNGLELADVKPVTYTGISASDKWISYIVNNMSYGKVKAFIWNPETLEPLAESLLIK